MQSILSLCFFNRPITILPYIFGLLVFLPFCFVGLPANDWPMFVAPFAMYAISFSLVYNFCLIYYFLLTQDKIEIEGIDVTFAKKPCFYILALCFVWLIGCFLWLLWLTLNNTNIVHSVFRFSMINAFVITFLLGGLIWYVKQRFLREALKQKKDPVKFISGVVTSIRSLLLEKVIDSK